MAKNTRPIQAMIQQWQPSIQVSWSLSSILSALRQHMAGDLARTSQMLKSMGEDDEIPGDLDKVADCVLKSPFTLDCDDESISEKTEPFIKDMIPDSQCKDLLRSKVAMGVAVGTIDWDTTGPLWLPRLRYLDPEYLYHDTGLRIWRYMAREGLQTVTPGDGTWFLHLDGEYGYYHGIIRALAKLWYFKQATFRDWNRYNERHGLPIIKAKIPLTSEKTEKRDFVDDIQEMGSEGIVALPVDTDEWNSYDLDLLEPKDQSWATFKAAIERADRKIQILLLGGNMSTELSGDTGSRAAATTHSDQLDRIKAAAISQRFSEDLQRQVFKPFVERNFGAGKAIPYPCWETEPPEDHNAAALAIKDFATGLVAMAGAGFTVTNLEEVGAAYGLELTYEKPEPVPVVAPAGAKKLASGDKADGAVAGVVMADAIADEVGAQASALIRPDVKTLIEMVRSATGYPDLEQRIRIAFNFADPSALADVLEQGMLLAQLDGRYAVISDVATETDR